MRDTFDEVLKKRKKAEAFRWTRADGQPVKTVTLSVHSAREGGYGLYSIQVLLDAGVPARRDRAGSPYEGHVAIKVPARYEKKASRLVL